MPPQTNTQAGAGGVGAYLSQMLSDKKQEEATNDQGGKKTVLDQIIFFGMMFRAGSMADALSGQTIASFGYLGGLGQTDIMNSFDLGKPLGNVNLIGERIGLWDLIMQAKNSDMQDLFYLSTSSDPNPSNQGDENFSDSLANRIPAEMINQGFKVQNDDLSPASLGNLSPPLFFNNPEKNRGIW